MSRQRLQQRVVLGAALAILGLVFLLDNFHLFDARRVLPFWPVVFIVIGALKIHQSRQPWGYLVGGGLMLAGLLTTLQHLGYIEFRWRDWWPLLLIAAGVMVILKGQFRLDSDTSDQPADALHGARLNIAALMSGNVSKVDAQDFSGAEIAVIMGGAELDLRHASMNAQATLQVFVLMGGLDIKIPNDWSVTINAVPLLGGIEDKSVPPVMPQKRLFINGFVLMGGIDIKN